MKNLVLSLTIFRIFAGPIIFVLAIFTQAYLSVFLIFIAASLSDFLDGRLARTYNVVSETGATLDPIADKILTLFALISITIVTNDPFIGGMSAIILAREFWISALREQSAKMSISYMTQVTTLAKIKTSIQFLAISLFFIGFGLDDALITFLASFILFLAMLITLKTGLDYSLKTIKFLN